MTEKVSRPDPDPTVLTTAALLREIESLKELFNAKLECIDKEMGDMHVNVHEMPERRAIDVAHLEKLIDEKFATIREKFNERFTSIDKQFLDRDTRVEQTAKASKEALDAALQAAKEAVGEQNKSSALSINKSEASTGKQIDQLNETLKQISVTFNDKIDDIKKRMDRYEGQGEGSMAERSGRRESASSNAMVIGTIAAIVLGLLSVAVTLSMRSSSPAPAPIVVTPK